MIRGATAQDRAAVESIVTAGYAPYVGRIGKPPGPMLDDYARLIDQGAVSLLAEAPGEIVVVVLYDFP